jgi:hypothetical protein
MPQEGEFRLDMLTNVRLKGKEHRKSEYDVMHLAGHSKFETTHRFYLAVADDLVDRARQASAKAFGKSLVHIWHAPLQNANTQKGQQAQVLVSPKVT